MGKPVTDKAGVAYGPPAGMTPAVMRMQHIGGYDTRTFAVALLSLVQEGHMKMALALEGAMRLQAGNSTLPPRDATQRWLKRALGVRKRDFIVGRQNYVRLMDIRRRHAQRLDEDLKAGGRSAGGGIMAALGLAVLMMIGAVAVYARAPVGASAMDVLKPFAWVPVVAFLGLYIWRRLRRGKKVGQRNAAEQVAGFHRYMEFAMADRLNPRFSVTGTSSRPEAAMVHAAAFGFENAWADPFVHLLEGLLPAEVRGTHAADPISGMDLPDKRGFAPRPQSRAWGIAPFVLPLGGEDADD